MNDTATLTQPSPARPRRGGRPAFVQRYWAFLSYSHKDAEVADWLHSSLERFRVPKAMVGRGTPFGLVPARLAPVFRDQHDLAAGDDLREDIQFALGSSRFLIVLCSPAAVASRWVNEEIRLFRKLRPDGEVLAAIVAGEPWAADMPGREAEECFPAALKEELDESGLPTGERAEPIAADLRTEGDGRQLGLQKLIAGMLDVGLDDLVQRDAHRRQRRMLALTGASVTGMIVTSGLALMAVQARDEARDQRREAEGLVGFMLGDLRDRLEPIGRLDALDSVGARALAYFEKQDTRDLSDSALTQRSKALTLMGEVANKRGDLDRALRLYQEAMAGTEEIVRRSPDDPQLLFEHAQNVFWVGYIDWQRSNLPDAASAFQRYRALADRMVELAPREAKYKQERISSNTVLGTVLMEQRRYRQAAELFESTLQSAEMLAASDPRNREFSKALTATLAWLADAREFSGQLNDAFAHRRRQLALLQGMLRADKGDTVLKRREMTAHRALARLFAARGDLTAALDQARAASATIEDLARIEPDNTEWQQAGASTRFERAQLELAAGRLDLAAAINSSACKTSDQLLKKDSSVTLWRTQLQRQCFSNHARIALKRGDMSRAMTYAQQALALARSEASAVDRGFAVSEAETLVGDALAGSGATRPARGAYQRALDVLPKNAESTPTELYARARLLTKVGQDSRPLKQQLEAIGYDTKGS